MRHASFLVLAAALAVATRPLAAQQSPTVSTLVVATGVQNREPVGATDHYDASVGQLACYMVVEGDFAETRLTQVWMQGDREMARVPLTAKGPRWRTWSTKTILPSWTGAWSVRVEDAQGNVLRSVDFTIG